MSKMIDKQALLDWINAESRLCKWEQADKWLFSHVWEKVKSGRFDVKGDTTND